ncbi:nuclear transport factor 2-like protein [Roseateles oligotrophus]|uniref:SnoaL-like domain-containing protein n=1 Tax=Roseateles oligotrophus TaxID=1769250 RepID=A0ABT2YKV0_9BURK|nr:hypothetical protein [Roseateles oligotrophus]MCV2370691.1 hypothetical protein [Roseateles oligotrophus]
MSSSASDLNLVRRFWALYQARQWAAAQALLHPQAACQWWATSERFEGAEAIVHVNAVYPEGWTIHLLELNALDCGGDATAAPVARRRVHSLVRVDQAEQAFYANSFFGIEQGLIVAIDEYWADAQPAPAWRKPGALPGLKRMSTDDRAGLSLKLDLP